MKKCRKCGEEKELTLFAKDSRVKSGYRGTCKACHALYMKQYWIDNPDKANLNRSRQSLRDKGRDRFIRHGITIGEYDDMVARYDGNCWSCRERPAAHIDHDHKCCSKAYSCGKCIRGILCGQCNTALGLLQDRVDLIDKLAKYAGQTS
jgi:hypothetical protein